MENIPHVDFMHAGKNARPERLSAATRFFAWESLNGRYGREANTHMAFAMDDVPDFRDWSEYDQYDYSIKTICENAPIRICEGERLSGAATLGLGIMHRVPTTLDGAQNFYSTSHLTVNFQDVLKYGVSAIEEEVDAKLAAAAEDPMYQNITPDSTNYRLRDTVGAPTAGPETGIADVPERRLRFWQSCKNTLNAFHTYHERYLSALAEKVENAETPELADIYAQNMRNLTQVPFGVPTSFHEALQSLWFTFSFLRLCGNWPGIGRIDEMLNPFLDADLEAGVITMDEAHELMAHFFIKGCEWVGGNHSENGDAQHYQNLVLSGVDVEGNDVTGKVTYLVLDTIEELGISDFPTTVRLSKKTDPALLRRLAEVSRYGGGAIAVYNEETIINAFLANGYSLSEARCFANDGCWETQVPGRTFFRYNAFDSFSYLQKHALRGYALDAESIAYYESLDSFEALYAEAMKDLEAQVEHCFDERKDYFFPETPQKWNKFSPCTTVSLFERGCVEKGLNYWEGGPIYNVNSPHIGGFADTVNALFAIKKLVYDEKRVTLVELIRALAADWEGYETLAAYARTKLIYFGNDSDEVDDLAARYLNDFANFCQKLEGRVGYHFPPGISTFGRQVVWAHDRLAAPHGYKKGAILAANASPTPGTDSEGATAIIKSYCKLPLDRMGTGAALDLRLLPSSVEGEDGLDAIAALYRGFAQLGGSFLQLDVLDAETLRAAQKDPESFRTLSVRVSGWNARFVTLDEEWQEGIIVQAENGTK